MQMVGQDSRMTQQASLLWRPASNHRPDAFPERIIPDRLTVAVNQHDVQVAGTPCTVRESRQKQVDIGINDLQVGESIAYRLVFGGMMSDLRRDIVNDLVTLRGAERA